MLGQGSCVRHKQSISGLFGGFEVPRNNPNLGAFFVFGNLEPSSNALPQGETGVASANAEAVSSSHIEWNA